jgi:hypothetical protein
MHLFENKTGKACHNVTVKFLHFVSTLSFALNITP